MVNTKVDRDSLPEELKRHRRWGLWRAVWRVNKAGKGKWEKVPLKSTNRPEEWEDFESVWAQYLIAGERTGIGFLMTGIDDLIAFDLDHCLDARGIAEPWAADLMQRLNTYTEVTVGGAGLRMFVHGRYALDWINRDTVSMEVYSGHGGRFVTLTGDLWPGAPDTVESPGEAVLASIAEQYQVSGGSGVGGGAAGGAEDMPDLLEGVEVPEGLNDEARRFLDTGEGDDDQSSALHWTARCLFEVGLTAQQVLSVLAENAYAMAVALDHRRQDEDRALLYLWQHHVCRSQEKARTRADAGDFEEDIDPLQARIAALAKLGTAEYEAQRKVAAKELGFREKVLDDLVAQARPKPKRADNKGVADVVAEINAEHCVAWCGGSLSAMKLIKGDWLPTDMTSLRQWYANKLVPVTSADGEVEMKNPADLWLCSKERKSYTGVEFVPGRQDLGDGTLNLWGGWALEPTHGDISPFLELTERVVFAEDQRLVEWGLDWVAHLFQKPASLPGKALLLQSGQGYGKNTWIDTIKAPLGSAFLQVSSPKHLVGDFNGHLANKLLVHGAESVWGGDKSKVGPLKALITDEDQAVEHKGKDVYTVRNYKRLVLSSNEDWPIPMDRDDRRFVVSRCAKAFDTTDPFWADYRKWRDAGGAARVFGYLLDRDISGFKPWERLDDVTTSAEIKLQSADALTQWWHSVLESGSVAESFPIHEVAGDWMENGEFGWALAIPRKVFWTQFTDWCHENRVRNIPSSHQRKKIIQDLCYPMRESQVGLLNRKPCFTFPTLAECRDEFRRAIGGETFGGSLVLTPFGSEFDDLL